MAFDFNPITGNLDLVDSPAGYINGVVDDPTQLPVTLGTPPLDAVYLSKGASGLWLINRKPAGLYCRVANDGDADDWTYLGAFPEVNSSANWSLYDGTTPSKELKFDLSGITTGTTRTITVPDANVTLPSPSLLKFSSTTSNVIEFEKQELSLTHTGNTGVPYVAVREGADFAVFGLRSGEMFFQGNNPNVRIEQGGGDLANILMAEAKIEDVGSSNGHFATITADNALTDDRTLTVPDASGTLALTSSLTDTQIFTSNGTWTKPAGAKMVHFIVIGGGGGGGSGRRDNAATNRCGGGGGGGGGISVGWLNESAFGATEVVTVGAGGAGGTARTTIGNGNAGSSGGASSIGTVVTTFASTGGGGGAGTSVGGGGGAINTARIYGPDGATGAGSIGRADAQPAVPTTQFLGPSGGSGGGGISAANAVFTGNVGGTLGNARTSGVILGGTFTASAEGGNGNSGGFNFTGSGGGGGSPDSSTGAGKNGGNGGLYGGGGGGGSGSTDPNNSGAGGNGANGIVIITTYF
jgi:hypothetical protein